MDDSPSNEPLSAVLDVLLRHRVDFILIGGQAEVLMGSPRYTEDVDVCYERSDGNLERVAAALRDLKVRLRNVPPDVPFIIDRRTLKNGANFTFETDIVKFDILGYVEPIGEYAELKQNATVFNSERAKFLVISLDDLIRIKEHIKRSKDSESLFQLYAIRRLRDESK